MKSWYISKAENDYSSDTFTSLSRTTVIPNPTEIFKMNGFILVAVVASLFALSSAVAPNPGNAVTKTDDVAGLGEIKVLGAIPAGSKNCYECSAPCKVAGKGCCADSGLPQCRQLDGFACRCTKF